jgi:hypothetical protein
LQIDDIFEKIGQQKYDAIIMAHVVEHITRKIGSASARWFVLCIGDSALADYFRKWEHLCAGKPKDGRCPPRGMTPAYAY